jgi:glycosyltransferase involved in cell wall biosynthesis
LEKFTPQVVHFFHLNRLGTGLIDAAVQAGIPAFMTPTDFWTICITGQLLLSDGSICPGPSAYAGNCLKHLLQVTQGGIVGEAAKRLPTGWAEMLLRFTRAGVLPPYPYRNEVKALSLRLGVNIARLNRLSKIVSPSGIVSDVLLRHGVLPHLIVQSAFGIDMTGNRTDTPRQPPRHPFRVGFIGTLADHKGCHVLINAFKALPQGSAVLKIYGDRDQYPKYAGKLKKLAGNYGAIEFCGTFHHSKIPEVIAGLDVLVVPSLWYENTPLVVYSAQAGRCPVIASDFPGISDVIRDGVNGLLFEAGNVGALVKQLSRLIDEPDLAAQLSSHCRPPKAIATYVDELLAVWSAL